MFNRTIISASEFAEFAAQGYTHIPVMQEILADVDTPVSTFLKLADQPFSYLFESVQGGDKWGRYSIIGLPAKTIFEINGFELTEKNAGTITEQCTVVDPLQTVRELQARYRVAPVANMPQMYGGLVGHFGYETVQYIEQRLCQENLDDPIGSPDILLMASEDVLVFDNVAGRIHLVTLAKATENNGLAIAQQRLQLLTKKLRESFSAPTKTVSTNLVSENDQVQKDPLENGYDIHFSQADFERAVETCRDYIREGDIMQVVLSQRLSTEFAGDPFDIYRALRTINPSPYMYYMHLGDYQIVGSSPEILVSLQDDDEDSSVKKVTVRPIAGTRKRGENSAEDLRLEQELLNDPKELAEHLMLIDLGRNDVGRIAKVGSVELTEQMIIERYSHVMHIVSNVDGELKPARDAIDVLAATFPAGTVSGAPKIRAMEIIAELEPYKRGIYSGAIGYLGWQGNMDTAIAIRTAVIKGQRLFLQTGAGIVADSVPEYEWQETMSKARAMLTAVELVSVGLHNDRTEISKQHTAKNITAVTEQGGEA